MNFNSKNNGCKRCSKYIENICLIKGNKSICSSFKPLDIYSFNEFKLNELYKNLENRTIHLINGCFVEKELVLIDKKSYINPLNSKEKLTILEEYIPECKNYVVTENKYPSSIEKDNLYFSPIKVEPYDN
jgi:hypothetical protein